MQQGRGWWLAALLLPVALITAVLLEESWRIYSHHGLLHSSIVYAIHDRGVPPENPLMAGAPIGYPYGHHALLAFVMRLVPLAPPWLFAATSWLALAATLLLLDRTSIRLGGDRITRALVLVLALFGSSPFARGPLSEGLKALAINEGRTIPLLKFSTVNSNQLGVLCLVLGLFGLVRMAVRGRVDGFSATIVALAWLANGLLYPTTWPAIVGCTGVFVLVLGVHSRVPPRTLALRLVLPCALAAVAVVSWILSVSAGRADVSLPQLALTPRHLIRNVSIALYTAFVPLVALWWSHRRLALRWDAPHAALGLSALGLYAYFTLFHLPLDSEYKFILVGQLPLAFVAARALAHALGERPWFLVPLAMLLVLPASTWLLQKVVSPRAVRDAATTTGRSIQALDADQRGLHEWIEHETPADAVLVDTHLSLPSFARRSLFVGTNERRRLYPKPSTGDGIDGSPQRWVVDVHGVDLRRYERRQRITRALVWKEGSERTHEVGRTLVAELPDRPIFVVAREPEARARLAASDAFETVFANQAAWVFRYAARD